MVVEVVVTVLVRVGPVVGSTQMTSQGVLVTVTDVVVRVVVVGILHGVVHGVVVHGTSSSETRSNFGFIAFSSSLRASGFAKAFHCRRKSAFSLVSVPSSSDPSVVAS